jgi:hypothetical protein
MLKTDNIGMLNAVKVKHLLEEFVFTIRSKR